MPGQWGKAKIDSGKLKEFVEGLTQVRDALADKQKELLAELKAARQQREAEGG